MFICNVQFIWFVKFYYFVNVCIFDMISFGFEICKWCFFDFEQMILILVESELKQFFVFCFNDFIFFVMMLGIKGGLQGFLVCFE